MRNEGITFTDELNFDHDHLLVGRQTNMTIDATVYAAHSSNETVHEAV